MASSDAEEIRCRYRHEPTGSRQTGVRHLFPHPSHAYPLTNAGAMLNIDCVTNTDEVIKDWVKALFIYQGVKRTEGDTLKTFITLTISGKVYNWFIALPEEIKAQYLRGTTTNDSKPSLILLRMKFDENFLEKVMLSIA